MMTYFTDAYICHQASMGWWCLLGVSVHSLLLVREDDSTKNNKTFVIYRTQSYFVCHNRIRLLTGMTVHFFLSGLPGARLTKT